MGYECERCGHAATLRVHDWGYVGALCDYCFEDAKGFLKVSGAQRVETAPEVPSSAAVHASSP
jgi:hypothetical protein